jgi:hypothetical protein
VAFSDIRHNRYRSAPNLRCESEAFVAWKALGDLIDLDHELHPDLPHLEVAIATDDLASWHGPNFSHAVEFTVTELPRRAPIPCAAARSPSIAACRERNEGSVARN